MFAFVLRLVSRESKSSFCRGHQPPFLHCVDLETRARSCSQSLLNTTMWRCRVPKTTEFQATTPGTNHVNRLRVSTDGADQHKNRQQSRSTRLPKNETSYTCSQWTVVRWQLTMDSTRLFSNDTYRQTRRHNETPQPSSIPRLNPKPGLRGWRETNGRHRAPNGPREYSNRRR